MEYSEKQIIKYGDLHYYGNDIMNRVYAENGLSPTICVKTGGGREVKIRANGVIRNMTPKECFRLMGFEDKDVDILIDNKISKTQLYKMAGNSICVPVLENIFREIFNQKILKP